MPPSGTNPTLQGEDYLSFISATIGAAGSTLSGQTGNPQTLLLGLMVSAIAKALPSLETRPLSKETLEDWFLLLSAIVGAFAAGVQSNLQFLHPDVLTYSLLVGLVLKTLASVVLLGREKGSLAKAVNQNFKEDIIPLVIGLSALIASLPLGPQYATLGVFFGFLAKSLSPQNGA